MSAISSYKVRLMVKCIGGTNAGKYKMLLPVKSFPQIKGEPELLETTTLEDAMQTFILGIQSSELMAFEANYDSEKFDLIEQLKNRNLELGVWFGNSGAGEAGQFNFGGQVSVYVNEGEVNGVVGMTVNAAPSSEIKKSKGCELAEGEVTIADLTEAAAG